MNNFTKSVLVTGANRGIGLEFIKQLVGRTEHLFAACRSPENACELKNIADTNKNVVIIKLDVTKENEIASAVNNISEIVGDSGLNCVINNAGMLGWDDLQSVTPDLLKDTYAVNTIGTAMVIKACLPLIRMASSTCSDSPMSVSRASILNISSKVGSITDNSSGRNYAYRMSKAALNMLTMNLSIELKNEQILAVNLHPGWVLTNMGGPNALIDSTKSVSGMLNVCEGLTDKDNGMFFGWNGEKIPW